MQCLCMYKTPLRAIEIHLWQKYLYRFRLYHSSHSRTCPSPFFFLPSNFVMESILKFHEKAIFLTFEIFHLSSRSLSFSLICNTDQDNRQTQTPPTVQAKKHKLCAHTQSRWPDRSAFDRSDTTTYKIDRPQQLERFVGVNQYILDVQTDDILGHISATCVCVCVCPRACVRACASLQWTPPSQHAIFRSQAFHVCRCQVFHVSVFRVLVPLPAPDIWFLPLKASVSWKKGRGKEWGEGKKRESGDEGGKQK